MEPALSPNDGNGLVTSRPQSVAEAVAITEELAREFSVSAADRDRAGGTPHHERKLLRRSGLLTLLVPQAYGGIGANWSTIQRVVQRFAQVDASIAHVFAFQHLMLATVRLFGSASQWGAHFTNTVRDGWFWGNAVNPLDARVTAVRGRAGELILTGKKSFCSGATDSDMLVVSAIPPEDTRLIIAAIPTGRKGVVVRLHDRCIAPLGVIERVDGTGPAVAEVGTGRKTLRRIVGGDVPREVGAGHRHQCGAGQGGGRQGIRRAHTGGSRVHRAGRGAGQKRRQADTHYHQHLRGFGQHGGPSPGSKTFDAQGSNYER